MANYTQQLLESLIGKTESAAIAILQAKGCSYWVLMRDSKVTPAPNKQAQISLILVNGVVGSVKPNIL